MHMFLWKRLLLVCFLIVLLTACVTGNDSPANSPVVQETPVIVSAHPAQYIEIGIGATEDDREVFDKAKEKIADAIDSLVQLNSGQIQIVVRLLKGGSFRPDPATDILIDIPPIPADPAPMLTSSSASCSGDPFDCADRESTATADNQRKQNDFQKQLKSNHAFMAQIKKQVRVKTDKVRALSPTFAETKDLWGYIGPAANRFQYVASQVKKQMIIAGSFNEVTYDEFIEGIVIPDVDVSFIYRSCTNQPSCEQQTAMWKERMLHAHARSVSCFDPIESEQVDLFPQNS